MRHRVQVLDTGLRIIREALHLDEIHREIAYFIPEVQHEIDLLRNSSELNGKTVKLTWRK